ncbi:hypothetical protein SELMODRAFT_406227 [Selaginella moellendorffii]|uniref:Cyanovirin-N domain-containing protein n=2 Tax=Selaginella moellendorffii TaxID=88036 RepID=D8R1P3_SELML|nr:hypothetical protein SELMODRAFT_406227 [Selaginella moellendorffii]
MASSPLFPLLLLTSFMVLLLMGTPSQATCGGFHNSCRDPKVLGATRLVLECQRSSGRFYAPTSIDLAWCLQVKPDGTLTCNNYGESFYPKVGQYSKCSEFHLAADLFFGERDFSATCKAEDGSTVTSTIDLKDCLYNDNGNIKCCQEFDLGRPGFASTTF